MFRGPPLLFLLAILAFLIPAPSYAQSYYSLAYGSIAPTTVNFPCDATAFGAIRYNTGNSSFEGCNGAAWGSLASGGSSSIDTLTDAVYDTATDHNMVLGSNTNPTSGAQDIVLIGELAGSGINSASADNNTLIGFSAGQNISSGNTNTAVGAQAMQGVSATPLTGANNTAVGNAALTLARGAAASNTAVGSSSLAALTTGTNSTAVGYQALSVTTATGDTALGFSAGKNITTGTGNTAIGNNAMLGVAGTPLTGTQNTAVGDSALTVIQGAAQQNVAVGYFAEAATTTGSEDVAIGYNALKTQTTGAFNTAVGFRAMEGNAGFPLGGNTFNTAVGASALLAVQSSGVDEVAVGYQAGAGDTTGAQNTFIGYWAGFAGFSITTGSNNVFLGYQAQAKAVGDNDEIVIGANATGMGSGSAVIGNANLTDAYFGMTTSCTNGVACGAGVTTTGAGGVGVVALHAARYNAFSDRRLKRDIQDSDLGLDFIEKLRPVSYYLKKGKQQQSYGFIAQEVETALGKTGTSMVSQEDDAMKTYELDYPELIAPLVKAVQQQQQEIADRKAENDELRKQLAQTQATLATMAQDIKALKAAPARGAAHP